MMVADLHRAFTLVGHVAVRTGYSRAGMNPLAPHFEFRMLRLQEWTPRLRVCPIFELYRVIVRENLIALQPVAPGIGKALLCSFEVVFDMALRADKGSQFLTRRHRIHLIVFDAIPSLQCANPFDKRGSRDAELHGVRGMAIDTGNGMLGELSGFRVWQGIHLLKALHHIALS